MSECPNCGNQVEDDTIDVCPHCDFSFVYEDIDTKSSYWYILVCLIIVLIVATPFLTIIFVFP